LGETPATEVSSVEEPAAVIAHVLKILKASGWEAGPGYASAPIQSKDKVLGVLCLFRRGPNELSHHERQTLAAIGHQIGVAIENVRLAEQTVEIEILRELDRLRSELIANVSHELRTPLGLIMLFCTTLLQQEVDLDRETQREFLNDIKEEADRLEKIVNNLLDLSRMQNGRLYLDRQPTDIARLVRATLASVRPQLTAHRLVYDFPPQPLVTAADSKRVEQILRNLVSNAIKYSPAGGEITIRGSSTENEILIQVSDQGVGIPPQDLTRVFERFYRVANETTQQVDGVGLGLAVCWGIVEAHGGRIWVESTPGIGSTFNFTLPAGPQAEAEAE
jgi:two-component system sensor histidine kinase KdpD